MFWIFLIVISILYLLIGVFMYIWVLVDKYINNENTSKSDYIYYMLVIFIWLPVLINVLNNNKDL